MTIARNLCDAFDDDGNHHKKFILDNLGRLVIADMHLGDNNINPLGFVHFYLNLFRLVSKDVQ